MLHKSSRFLALLTVGALSATALLHPTPAHADKAKNYKYGAIALGVVGGYLLSKGKTVEGAAVLGAGAYTYKKGEDARKSAKDDRYGRYDYNRGDRYSRYPDARYPDARNDRYPDARTRDNRDRYDSRYDARYPTSVNGNYGNSNGTYRARNDSRYRDNRYRNDVRVR